MSVVWGGRGGGLFVKYARVADLSEWKIYQRGETLGDDVTVLVGKLANVSQFWKDTPRVTVKLKMSACLWVWDICDVQTLDPLEVWMHGEPRSEPKS